MHCKLVTTISLVTVTIQSEYNIIDYILWDVQYNLMTYLFYKWEFIPLDPLKYFIFMKSTHVASRYDYCNVNLPHSIYRLLIARESGVYNMKWETSS